MYCPRNLIHQHTVVCIWMFQSERISYCRLLRAASLERPTRPYCCEVENISWPWSLPAACGGSNLSNRHCPRLASRARMRLSVMAMIAGALGTGDRSKEMPMMSKSWDGHGDLDIGMSHPQALVNCIQMTYACSASCKGPIWSTSSTQCCMAKAKRAATVSMTHAGNLAKPRGANLPPNSKLRAIQNMTDSVLGRHWESTNLSLSVGCPGI